MKRRFFLSWKQPFQRGEMLAWTVLKLLMCKLLLLQRVVKILHTRLLCSKLRNEVKFRN